MGYIFHPPGQENGPRFLYVDGKAAHLLKTNDHFALYNTGGKPEIDSTYLPQMGMHDVQVVSISDELNPLVVLGEYDEGQLFFPSFLPQANGIVLYRLEDAYLPVGIYEKRSGSFSPLSKLEHFADLVNYRMESFPKEDFGNQEYFVLENDTMQVVFSNLGGAIAEINLPFKSENDSESIVLPIGFDRTIDKSYPSNGMFPNHSYHAVDPSGQTIIKKSCSRWLLPPYFEEELKKTVDIPLILSPHSTTHLIQFLKTQKPLRHFISSSVLMIK